VADFRDEWTNNPYTLDNPYNPIRTSIEKKMEYSVLTSADALISNTPVMVSNFINNNGLKGDNFYCIPNGFDVEDFAEFDTTKPQNTRLTMVYTGALYGRRKPDTFFEALKQLKAENKIDGNKVLVKLIGNYHKDKLQAQIDSYGLTGQFEIVGYVPHNVCIKEQLGADVLVLIEGTGRGSNAFYTGKIFEYMNTGRPVLAVLPEDGAAADLVRESKIGIVSHTDNVEAIKTNIKKYYDDWCNNTLDFMPDRGVIDGFERKALTKKLAEVFDKVYK
jgi:glycosyltransferase involved in cell wall biosynthesis